MQKEQNKLWKLFALCLMRCRKLCRQGQTLKKKQEMDVDKYSTDGYDYIPNRTAWRDGITYDIEKLWKLTDDIKGEDIAVDRLLWVMDNDCWSDLDGVHTKDFTMELLETEQYICANDVIASPLKYQYHFQLIEKADLSYPILLVDERSTIGCH